MYNSLLSIIIILFLTLPVYNQILPENISNRLFYPSVTSSKADSYMGEHFSIQIDHKLDSIIAIGLSGEQLKSVYTYDGDKVVKAEKGYFVDGSWMLDDRILLTYNEQGQILENKMQSLQYDSVWIDYWRNSYEYNEANKLTSTVIQTYIDGEWENASRTLVTYPNDFEERLVQYFNLGEWIDRTLFYNYISNNGNIDSTFIFQRGDTTWNNYLRWYRHYNEFNKWDYVIAQQWFSSTWTNQASMEGVYDGNGNITKMNYYDWSNQFEELKSRLIYSYDNEGNLIEVFNEFKTVDGWFPAQMDPILINVTEDYAEGYLFNRVKLYYSPINSVKNDRVYTDFTLSQNYPNPFNPTTTIKFTVANVGTTHELSLRVYDILGREIQTLLNKPMQLGSYEVEFNGSNLTSGVYFYVLETGGNRLTKKMLLVK
jgi:hypothetical protein